MVQGALGAELRWPSCFSHAQPYCFIITQHPSEMQANKRAGRRDCIYHSEPFLRHFNVWKLLTIDWSGVLWWHLADSPLVFLWSAGGLGEQPFMWQCERLQFRLLAGAQVMTEGRFWKMEKKQKRKKKHTFNQLTQKKKYISVKWSALTSKNRNTMQLSAVQSNTFTSFNSFHFFKLGKIKKNNNKSIKYVNMFRQKKQHTHIWQHNSMTTEATTPCWEECRMKFTKTYQGLPIFSFFYS